MLVQTKRKAEVDGINELGLLQNQVSAPDNWLEIMLDNLGQHMVGGE
jgi:hypothetical protein